VYYRKWGRYSEYYHAEIPLIYLWLHDGADVDISHWSTVLPPPSASGWGWLEFTTLDGSEEPGYDGLHCYNSEISGLLQSRSYQSSGYNYFEIYFETDNWGREWRYGGDAPPFPTDTPNPFVPISVLVGLALSVGGLGLGVAWLYENLMVNGESFEVNGSPFEVRK
jgi:hypothetical protein